MPTTNVLVLFYSMYGHVYRMAEAVAEGARQAPETEVTLKRVPELVPDDVLEKSGAKEAQETFKHVPVVTVEELDRYDCLLLGTPTRYGNMTAQMRNYLDQTGEHWAKGKLIGKTAGVFTSTQTQHGGQESTILSTHITLLHLGYVIVGMPYSVQEQMTGDEIAGGSPYGASLVAGGPQPRPSELEKTMAHKFGEHVVRVARKVAHGPA